ncbi:MAG: DUF503 domain-containing protein [Candidatus Rokubacteria bacterium]|nr:DUF503 domain-containing protein [Candidatus Rokubacteria bacterium]
MHQARVAVGTVELHLPDVDSLKGKRHILKGLKEKVRQRFEVSVAEVNHQDTWQRATLAIACAFQRQSAPVLDVQLRTPPASASLGPCLARHLARHVRSPRGV